MYIYLTNIIGFFFDLLVISICSNKWNEYAIIFRGAIIIFDCLLFFSQINIFLLNIILLDTKLKEKKNLQNLEILDNHHFLKIKKIK